MTETNEESKSPAPEAGEPIALAGAPEACATRQLGIFLLGDELEPDNETEVTK
jgi:hypothetical protein